MPAMHEIRSLPLSRLPTPLTPLVGREQEIAAVCALLWRPEVRFVTLTGTGGVGKTRLALGAAETASSAFADGACFVNLASLSDPGLVVSTIAQTLDVREHASQPLLERLQDSLRQQQELLLLDNFEHLVSVAPVVAELLAAAPALKVLVTSRASLHLSGEHEFVVPPLALPDLRNLPPPDRLIQYGAIRLFVERAQAVHAAFALTAENAPAVAAICHQVDGLPLGIELAARRSKLFSPQALLPRLKSRLHLLVGGAREKPAHQQTLRGTMAWSYELLEKSEKTLFRRLAVFAGGCTLEAVQAVCADSGSLEGDLLDNAAGLVDQSLLRQTEQPNGEPRFLMLETIREYALERLNASGEAEAIERQHATFFLAMAEEAEPKMRSGEQSAWIARLQAEHDNLRAALGFTLEHEEAEIGLRLAGALFPFWRSCNHSREGRSWLEQVLAQPHARARTAARAKALYGAGAMAFFHGDYLEAQRLLEESVSIGRELGAAGKRNLAHALTTLGQVALFQGNPIAARELAGEGARLFQEVGEAWGTALALLHLGRAAVETGDFAAARSLLEESAALFRVSGDRQRLALPVDLLGMVALRQGDYGAARLQFEEALAVAQEMEDAQFMADALLHLGAVAWRRGDARESAALYQQSLALYQGQGYKDGISESLSGLAEVAVLSGQPEQAARLCGAVEALREASHSKLSPLRHAAYDRLVRDIRTRLADARFTEAFAEGRAMELSLAIAFARALAPSPPLSPRTALQHAGGLTAREREVARLVAQGKSNRAIADELVVGVSTVEAHLTHIFSKLEVSSRAQLATWVVKQGLDRDSQDAEGTGQ